MSTAANKRRAPRWSKRAPHGRPRPLWLGPALLLVTFLVVIGSILWVTHENNYRAKRNDLAVKADSLGKSLRLNMEGNAAYLLMLALERSSGKLNGELFQERASQYVKSHPELINITWVDADFFIRDVAPFAQNRQIVGLKLNLPEPKRVSRLAMERRQPVYTRPFEAIQGKPSFEIWVPVYKENTFLGLFGGVYSCERLVNGLASQAEPLRYHFSLLDASGRLLGELPLTALLEKDLAHTALIGSEESGIYLRGSAYHSGQDWRLTVLELVSVALVLGMAFALWQLKREIEVRRGAQETLKKQAAQLVLEVEERQMAQESLEEQATMLEEEIAERRQAEEALISSEEKLRLILDSTGEAIYGVDLKGRCTFCNSACLKLLGYSHPGELLGADMHLRVHHSPGNGGDLPAEKQPVRQVFFKPGERTHAADQVLWRSDGSYFAAECWSYPQYRQGELIGAVVTFINITQRKQLEEQFRHSQKMESIGRLAGGVAHDFNNMLSVILGAAELSKCKVQEGDAVLQYLDLISKAAMRSSEITRQLLAFSRKEVISPKPLNLNALIIESEKILARLISEEIKLSFRPAPELWTVMIDPSQVDQILMNLSVNARDAMPDGGSLTIETANCQISDDHSHFHPNALPGEYVLLTISDTGIGMDQATREHIFEPFFTTKGLGQGTGLGLATVYGIVTQNGGFINVYSEPGHGTVFKMYLPRLMQEAPAEAKSAPKAANLSATILLVEDEDMLLWMATKLLEELGYTVIQAQTPDAAISICQQGQELDMVLTDVVMPGMNGSEMVTRIKAIRPRLKVLFMSGYTAEIVAQRGIVEEGMHYIQKPLEMSRLDEKLREVLAGA